jgi:dienelactone hydrolase
LIQAWQMRLIKSSSCCLSGKIQNESPAGQVTTIGNLPTYVAAPKDGSKAKTVVFITDVFGWEFKNVRLLADNYAKAGFYCYVPDVLEGDALPIELLKSIAPPLKDQQESKGVIEKVKDTVDVSTTFGPWMAKHREAVSRPIVESFIKAVREIPGTGKIGAIGFCWGGRLAILAGNGTVDAVVACHPSGIAVPGDFENVTKPFSLAVGSKDTLLDEKTVGNIQDHIAKKTGVPHELRIYEDQVHGFALRGDWSSEKDRKAMDETEKQGQEWFAKYLS